MFKVLKLKLSKKILGSLLATATVFGLIVGSFSPPYIESIEPLNEVSKVSFNAPFTVRFSHLMNKKSTEEAFQIIPRIPGNIKWKDGRTMQFHPENELEISDNYEINISKEAQSLWFKKIGNDQNIKFTVTGPPYLQFKHPKDGETLGQNQAITVMFDRPMNFQEKSESDLIEINPKLKGEIKYLGKTAFQFVPKEISSDEVYEIKVASGLMALDGGETTKEITWSLKTASNKVSSAKPNTEVELNEAIEVTFESEIELEKIRPGANALLFPSNDIDANISEKEDGFFNTEVTYAQSEEGETIKNKLIFKPSFPYLYNKDYRFVLKANEGLNLEEDFELKFKTIKDPNEAEETPEITNSEEEIINENVLTWNGNNERHFFIRGENPRLKLRNPTREEAEVNTCQLSSNRFIELTATGKLESFNCETQSETLEIGTQNIDLNEIFPQNWDAGIYYVSIENGEEKIWTILSIQDVGMLVKKSDNELLVWVTDVKSGKPIEEMEIELISYDGTLISKGETDENGLFLSSKSLEEGLYIRGRKETDSLSRWGFLNESWKINKEKESEISAEKIKVLVDKNTLKAGEKIQVKGIWREEKAYELALPEAEQITLGIKDIRGNLIFDRRVPLRRNGSFDAEIQLPEQVVDGEYKLFVADINKQSISKDYEIFIQSKEASIELEWKNEKKHYLQNTVPTFQIQARYKSGLPANQLAGNFKLYRMEDEMSHQNGATQFSFKAEKEKCQENCNEIRLVNQGGIEFDKEGEFSFNLSNQNGTTLKAGGLYNLKVETGDTQLIHSFKIHQGEYQLGLGVPHALKKVGEDLEFELATFDQDGKLINGKEIEVQLVRRDNEDEIVFSKKYSSEAREISANETLENNLEEGIYILRASGKDGEKNNIVAEENIYIHSNGEKELSNKLMLVADQKSYLVGGRAKLLINEDSASEEKPVPILITYERNGLLGYEFVELTKPTTDLNIPIKNEMLPRFLVKATRFSRGTLPEYSEASLELEIENERHEIDVKMNTEINEEEGKLKLKIETYDFQKNPLSSIVTLNISDLSLENYKLNAESFYASKANSSKNSSNIGKYKEENKAPINQKNISKPTLKNNSYYYNPIIQTDENGEAEVEIELPKNASELNIHLLASNKIFNFGYLKETINLNKGFSIKPVLPNFVSRGDQTVFSAIIKNISESNLNAQFKVDSNAVAFQGDQSRNISLSPGQQTTLSFNVFVDRLINEDSIVVTMKAGEDEIEKEIPLKGINNTLDLIQTSQMGEFWSGRINAPKTAHTDKQTLNINLSPTPINLVNSIKNRIKNDQYVSTDIKVIELLAEAQLLDEKDSKAVNLLSFLTSELQEESNSQGAYSTWGTKNNDAKLTAMAAIALGKAEQKGVIVDQEQLRQVLSFLLEVLSDENTEKEVALMSLWGLAENEQFDTEEVLTLFKEREDMSSFEKALLLINLEKIKQAGQTSSIAFIERLKGEMIDGVIRHQANAFFEGKDKEVATAASLFALSLSDDRNPVLEAMINYLSNENLRLGKSFNPIKGLWKLLAFDAYAKGLGQKELNYITKVKLNGKLIVDQSLTSQENDAVYEFKEELINNKAEEIGDVFLHKDGTGPLYFDLQLNYNEDPEKIDIVEENLILVRELKDLEGKVIERLRVGESYVSELTLVVPENLEKVVIIDPSSAGTRIIESLGAYNELFDEIKISEQGIEYRANELKAGVYELKTTFQASIPGTYHALPAEAISLFNKKSRAQSQFKLIQIAE